MNICAQVVSFATHKGCQLISRGVPEFLEENEMAA